VRAAGRKTGPISADPRPDLIHIQEKPQLLAARRGGPPGAVGRSALGAVPAAHGPHAARTALEVAENARMPAGPHWSAIGAARACRVPRVPFLIEDRDPDSGLEQALQAGSVAVAHLEALARWPEALRVEDGRVTLRLPRADRDPFFAQANAALREAGLIVAWRDETFPVLSLGAKRLLATFERAAARFWGTTTFGAHCNGYVADAQGRPTRLWVARRSFSKATDPGLLDNLVGGGVPHGQTPMQALLREGWEEAGLRPEQMRALRPGRVVLLERDIAEGFQREEVSVFDLALPEHVVPCNQDGEVAETMLLPVDEALASAAGDEMTVDAALVVLDFALRHRLFDDVLHGRLAAASARLWLGPTSITA
jgi:8-oxo-dGTP pyrophosphatase MutT (NUDIX family)